MTPYADTNFFTSSLLDLPQSSQADHLLDALSSTGAGPLPVTWLLRIELTNALQRLVHESRHGSQRLRITPEAALIAEVEFLRDLEEGVYCREQSLDLTDWEATFDVLAHRYTAKYGFRTYDLLNVASAILLGCDTYWSFDIKANKLAKLEGLDTI